MSIGIDYLRGMLGLAALVGVGYLLCSDRRHINWRLVGSGIVLQWLIALLLLKVPPVRAIFEGVSTFFIRLLDFSRSGSEFLFDNFASIGIQVGGISAIAPAQRENLVRLGFKAMIAGTIAALITRLTNDAVTITTSESFTGKPGGNEFTPLALPPITLQATAEDTDGDGINDAWENLWFSNLDTADASTDFDGDGTLDINHFLNDTNPRIPHLVSTPYLDAFTRSGPTRLALTFPTDSNALYRLQSQTSLFNQVWSDLVFSLTPSGALSAESLTGTGTNTTLYLDLPGTSAQFFRLQLRE
jgi:hypothetical protein